MSHKHLAFVQVSHNEMLLLQHHHASADGTPLYRISIQMDCFKPLSRITMIHQLSTETEEGLFVGEFEYVSVFCRLGISVFL